MVLKISQFCHPQGLLSHWGFEDTLSQIRLADMSHSHVFWSHLIKHHESGTKCLLGFDASYGFIPNVHYKCTYTYMYTYTCTCIYTHINTYKHIHIYEHTYAYMPIQIHTHTHTHFDSKAQSPCCKRKLQNYSYCLQVRPLHPWANSTTTESTFIKPRLLCPLQHTMEANPARGNLIKLETK